MKEVLENPTARIAVKRNVVKVYEVDKTNKVFLKDGTEFEIELFNPTRNVILCKFKLNGKFTNDGGLILNPGQRVFLERYLDENKKFMFETYVIDNTPKATNAAANNGLIEISFYKEIANDYSITYIQSPDWTYRGNYFYYDYAGTTGNIGPSGILGLTGTNMENLGINSSNSCTGTSAANYTVTCNTKLGNSDVIKASSNLKREEKETGRVEKGSNSGQVLTYANKYFSSCAFHTVNIKILPDGEKIYETDDLKHKRYCPECGAKLKTTDKFCSQCGHKV